MSINVKKIIIAALAAAWIAAVLAGGIIAFQASLVWGAL